MKFYNPSVTMIDFPDEIGVVVFTRGCNLRCPICHNPSLVEPKKYPEVSGYRCEEVIGFAKDRWADGICITGGEPLLHTSLPMNIEWLKDAGFKVKLDTNGTRPIMLKQLLDAELLDFVAMDVKAPLRLEALNQAVGFPWETDADKPSLIDLLISSMAMIKRQAPAYHFRTVCFEKFLSPKNVGEIAEMLKPEKHYVLLPFDPHVTLDPTLMQEDPASYAYLRACLLEARKHIPETRISGMDDPDGLQTTNGQDDVDV